jgi:hypothetical protein
VRSAGVQVGEPLARDAAVLCVDERFVAFHEISRNDRCRTLMSATARDVGDLTAERSAVHGI